MTENQEQKWHDMTLQSLEAQLRSLPEVDVPEELEAKLLEAIADRVPDVPARRQVERHPGLWDFGVTAAAAVLIVASILTVNYGLSNPSQIPSRQLKDTSLCYTAWEQPYFALDQNNAPVEDTNYLKSYGQR